MEPVQLDQALAIARSRTCLEPNSPSPSGLCGCGACVPLHTRHSRGEQLSRHRHDNAFAAVVISGTYVEAGDTGRHRVGPGEVVFHRPFESHLDRFDRSRVEVLNLPLPVTWVGPVLGTIDDPDLIARLAERDLALAVQTLAAVVVERVSMPEDWPDALATELLEDPDLSLTQWSDRAGLHAGSLSRGFRQQFGITPARFRSVVRTHRAIRHLARLELSDLAAACGFADQAHMSRATKQLTGFSPAELKRRLNGVSRVSRRELPGRGNSADVKIAFDEHDLAVGMDEDVFRRS